MMTTAEGGRQLDCERESLVEDINTIFGLAKAQRVARNGRARGFLMQPYLDIEARAMQMPSLYSTV